MDWPAVRREFASGGDVLGAIRECGDCDRSDVPGDIESQIREFVQHGDPGVRKEAIKTLGRWASDTAAEDIAERLDSLEDTGVQSAAIFALGSIGARHPSKRDLAGHALAVYAVRGPSVSPGAFAAFIQLLRLEGKVEGEEILRPENSDRFVEILRNDQFDAEWLSEREARYRAGLANPNLADVADLPS